MKKTSKTMISVLQQCIIDELDEGKYTPHAKSITKIALGKVMKERLNKARGSGGFNIG